MKKLMMIAVVAASALAGAQETTGRDAFLARQAADEAQRIAGQLEVLQGNHDELVGRVARVEGLRKEIDALRAEIAALKGVIQQLHKEMSAQRDDIVDDLTQRIKKMRDAMTPPPPSPTPTVAPRVQTPRVAYAGPLSEYKVASGDTLSRIAVAFGTTVPKLREINALKSDVLRVGQTIRVPQPKEGK